MFGAKEFEERIFRSNNAEFEDLALELFKYQAQFNRVYRAYVDSLQIEPRKVRDLRGIPFLPIGFFKTHRVVTGDFAPRVIFESSGTTQTFNSRHFIRDSALYERSFRTAFEHFYGPVKDYVILGLLPSYLERGNSSLVYMAEALIRLSGRKESGFYLYEYEKLKNLLEELELSGQKTLLLGVTFALLDFSEKHSMNLCHTVVMETGGMKGRREELTREEVHDLLKKRLGAERIHSEYGMTELLSQAYSAADGLFRCPAWMKILIRDEDDPLSTFLPERSGYPADKNSTAPVSGIINVIDLANIHSCAFVATEDIGELYADGSFNVLGRMDNSALRGCSLMVYSPGR